MSDAMDCICNAADLLPERINLFLLLHIAQKHGGTRSELSNCLSALLRTYRKKYVGSGIEQQLRRLPRHTFAIGNTHHQDVFAFKLQEVHTLSQHESTPPAKRHTANRIIPISHAQSRDRRWNHSLHTSNRICARETHATRKDL